VLLRNGRSRSSEHLDGLNGRDTQRWGDDPRVQRLCTIPGIGPFIATVLVLELGDIARFAHAKQVASYAGLTPRVRASADRIRSGHITKEGNRLLAGSWSSLPRGLSAGPGRCGRGSSP
jgi:transposase